MPDLAHSLRDHDLEHLTNIAELWGIEINAPGVSEAVAQLSKAVLDPSLVLEIIPTLSEESLLALSALEARHGRLPWAQFTRRFGTVREMGPGRRSRQHPHRNLNSAAETLWYHAFISRAFFDNSAGPEEFAYIPDDLRELLRIGDEGIIVPFGPILGFQRELDLHQYTATRWMVTNCAVSGSRMSRD